MTPNWGTGFKIYINYCHMTLVQFGFILLCLGSSSLEHQPFIPISKVPQCHLLDEGGAAARVQVPTGALPSLQSGEYSSCAAAAVTTVFAHWTGDAELSRDKHPDTGSLGPRLEF